MGIFVFETKGNLETQREKGNPEVTPTALIIFCFALSLFSTTNFQQSPWRRAGEGGGLSYGNPGA